MPQQHPKKDLPLVTRDEYEKLKEQVRNIIILLDHMTDDPHYRPVWHIVEILRKSL
jgi:hypothetical protein